MEDLATLNDVTLLLKTNVHKEEQSVVIYVYREKIKVPGPNNGIRKINIICRCVGNSDVMSMYTFKNYKRKDLVIGQKETYQHINRVKIVQ